MKDIEFLLSNCGIFRIEISNTYGVNVYTEHKFAHYDTLEEFGAFVERCKAQKSK